MVFLRNNTIRWNEHVCPFAGTRKSGNQVARPAFFPLTSLGEDAL